MNWPDERMTPMSSELSPNPASLPSEAAVPVITTVQQDSWVGLRALTPARIAIGRTGASQPTHALLEFSLAHAQARDAVHEPFDAASIMMELQREGFSTLAVHSRAQDRAQYLRRPDLGRRVDEVSAERLRRAAVSGGVDLVFVVADGLSALAVMRHAVPLLRATAQVLSGWSIGPIVVAEQSRVALADEAGELLGARAVAILIGERPGLSSPDSLGVYLTWAPRVGRSDAERNCISNIRPQGLSFEQAARTLAGLLEGARKLGLTGVMLKDDTASMTDGTRSVGSDQTDITADGRQQLADGTS